MKIAIFGYPTFLDPVDSCVAIDSDPIGRANFIMVPSWVTEQQAPLK